MLVADDRKSRIVNIYKLFKVTMRRYGKSVSFPKTTDPTKTYSWRYLSKFIDDYDKLDLDDSELPVIIEEVIRDAKKRGILRCGIAILNKIDLLAVCNRKFERDVNDEKQSLDSIRRSHDFLYERLGGERNKDQHVNLVKLLTARSNRRSYANITRWFSAGNLSIGYIAVSKSCKQAIMSFRDFPDELILFPTAKQFVSIRLRLISRENVLHDLRQILDNDLFEE